MFRSIVEELVQESFPGTTITQEAKGQRKPVINVKNQNNIGILLPSEDSRLVLHRSQVFKEAEKTFIEKFVDHIYSLSMIPERLVRLVSKKLLSRVVAESLLSDQVAQTTLLEMIETLETWSSETYEGGGIASGFLLDPDTTAVNGVPFSDYVSNDFAKVLSNGFDTIAEFTANGQLGGYIYADSPDGNNWRSPYRYSQVSKTTLGNAKIAVLLNRNGEILIFKDDSLMFAKRRGSWVVWVHDTVLEKLAFGNKMLPNEIRQAIYSSALDVSFARCGGTIAIFSKTKTKEGKKEIHESDFLGNSDKVKSLALSQFNLAPFKDIDRRLKQEMIGIDGATVLDHEGNLMVVGAIVKVDPGSDEGGRSAATKSLSRFGLAMKISNDGKISVFKGGEKKFTFA